MSEVITGIENEEEEILWAPNDFGTYSIEKIEVIAKILQNVMKDMVITVKNDTSSDDGSYYTKEESNNYFLRKTDYRSMASETLNEIVQSNIDRNVLLSVSDFNSMVNAVDFLARICFSLTYNQLKAAGNELTFVPFHTQINNLSSRVSSFDDNIDKLLYAVFKKNSDNSINYNLVEFVKPGEVYTKSEVDNLLASLDRRITSLEGN